jgi:hypothetical protein
MSGIRDQGSGIRNQESGIRNQGSGIRDQGSGIRDQMKTDFYRERRERRERSVFAKRFRAYPCFAVLEVWVGLGVYRLAVSVANPNDSAGASRRYRLG